MANNVFNLQVNGDQLAKLKKLVYTAIYSYEYAKPNYKDKAAQDLIECRMNEYKEIMIVLKDAETNAN